MSKQLGIAQILEITSQQKTKEEKVQFLRNNFSPTLADVLIIALNPNIKSLLPEGAPPYRVNDMEGQEHMMYREVRKFPLFLEGGGDHLNRLKRESLFIGVLESVAPKDAELVILMKDKQLPYGITKELVDEAFPDLLPKG